MATVCMCSPSNEPTVKVNFGYHSLFRLYAHWALVKIHFSMLQIYLWRPRSCRCWPARAAASRPAYARPTPPSRSSMRPILHHPNQPGLTGEECFTIIYFLFKWRNFKCHVNYSPVYKKTVLNHLNKILQCCYNTINCADTYLVTNKLNYNELEFLMVIF